jgi:predicted RNA methylase
MKIDLQIYDVDKYLMDLDTYGMEEVWKSILNYISEHGNIFEVFNIDNFGYLYEMGLAHLNKDSKKKNGCYYTPKDVSNLLADFFVDLDGDTICDVGCGVGNLTLAYLEKLGRDEARNLILNEKLYLYDIDSCALNICKYSIGILYGLDVMEKIHIVNADFLDKSITLPVNAKVISNPPYFKIDKIQETWEDSEVIKDTKEYYSSFMEKIILNSVSSVIITSYSFISGEKFYSLRKQLNNYGGSIYSFDNVPGSIFKGKKHGVFNTNTVNSVRAAITVIDNHQKGFKISPLIRFKNESRDRVLNKDYLISLLSDTYQFISKDNKSYYKCFKELEPVNQTWVTGSNKRLKDLLVKDKTDYAVTFVNTCRYVTTASRRDLSRTGKYCLYMRDRETYDYVYAFLNSSFTYWYWRMYDGGITYARQLLESLPVFYSKFTPEDLSKLHEIVQKMEGCEEKNLVYKKNSGVEQENINFPDIYRNKLDDLFLRVLGLDVTHEIFTKLHSNNILD